jgi:hypothetical protein
MKKKKFAYIFFHLNLFFSSLPENKRKEVIKKCYWPLLNLIDKYDYNIGIEITGWTLNEIQKLDQKWIIFFKKLLKQKKTYLIGSSYTQAIFPLIPDKVNYFNIKYGKQIYKKILNQVPRIAYVNEQCFSKSVVDLYKSQKYKTLIIDWDCIKNNKNINQKYKFYPQKLKGNKSIIDVIWNSSVNFQNFQKAIHSKLNQPEYFELFKKVNKFQEGIINIYGSDVEIFDFRLKRFENETNILNKNQNEWKTIHEVLNQFKKKYILLNLNQLSQISFKSKFQKKLIDITSLQNNLPTKKQKKYNPLRWYVGGQDNYAINTLCWRIYLNNNRSINILKKLCYYWSSDFRTHIKKNRWKKFFSQIQKEEKKLIKKKDFVNEILHNKFNKINLIRNNYLLESSKNSIYYSDAKYFFEFDKERGISLTSFGIIKDKLRCSYLTKYNQGYFCNDKLNADFYNGHNIAANSNIKFSDLDERGDVKITKKNNFIIFSNKFFRKDIIHFEKKWYFDTKAKVMYLHNKIKTSDTNFLIIRSNYFNLNHKMFNFNKLKVSTKNGGQKEEFFSLKGNENFFHDEALSTKNTAQNCFGNTGGNIIFSDNKNKIDFKFFNQVGISAPMLCFQKDKNNSYFLRLLTSFLENNDIKSSGSNKIYESLVSIKIN